MRAGCRQRGNLTEGRKDGPVLYNVDKLEFVNKPASAKYINSKLCGVRKKKEKSFQFLSLISGRRFWQPKIKQAKTQHQNSKQPNENGCRPPIR